MALGATALTTQVWRDRRRTAPPPAAELDAEQPPATLYDATIAALGNPHADWPEFTPPTTHR
jgi:hypothetical protein